MEDFVAGPTVFNLDPTTTTLSDARDWLTKESKGSKGAHCPCCQKPDRTVARKVTAVHAAVLILLHRAYKVGDEVNIQQFIESLNNKEFASRDWNRLTYWDLLEPTKDKAVFRLCDGGFLFAFKGHLINEKVWVRDESVVAREPKLVSIINILGQKFDINDLLRSVPIPTVQLGGAV